MRFPETLEGGCLCARVRFRLRAPVTRFVACHCSRCRKSSGSSHASNLAVPPDQFAWLSGEALIGHFELKEAARFGRCFCTHCGGPVPRSTRDGQFVVVPAGAVDTGFDELPEHMHLESCAGWDPIAAPTIQGREWNESTAPKDLAPCEMHEGEALAVAQAAQWRFETLASASAVLSKPLEEASTLQAIAAVIVPAVGDLCRIDLLNEEGILERKLTHHSDPARSAQIARLVEGRTASPDAQGSFPWAVSTGKTFLHNADDPLRADDGIDPSLRDFVQTVGITAGCVVPLVTRGRTIGAMAVLQDKSGRRLTPADGALIGELAQRAATALDNVRLLAQARNAQNRAEVASKAKDEFLAMLGHELRNPLAPISLALTLIERKDSTAFLRERGVIERQVRHLSRLVDDLLDISRIVAGKIALRPELLDLRDIVSRAIELTLPMLQTKARLPRVSMPAEAVPVNGDPLRLAQVVCNLLNNAAKFTAPDGHISVTLDVIDLQARLEVADDGTGIAPELLPIVFDRFVQAEQQLQRAQGGLGLGLAIARSLTELHGGSIEACSGGLGQGSSFMIVLPLATALTPESMPSTVSTRSEKPLRLLLVDDNQDLLQALAEWFRLEGHQALTAGSAEDALALLESHTVDAGVFDLGLPAMSGYELARRVRANKNTGRISLLALSGYGQESDKQHALAAGFDAHFTKPPQLDALLGCLQQFVAGR